MAPSTRAASPLLALLLLALGPWAAAGREACEPSADEAVAGAETCAPPQSLQDEVGLVQLHKQIKSARVLPKEHSMFEPPPASPPPGRDPSHWRARVKSFKEWSSRWIFGYSEYCGRMVMEIVRHLPGHRKGRPEYALLDVPGSPMVDGGEGMPVVPLSAVLACLLLVGVAKWLMQRTPAAAARAASPKESPPVSVSGGIAGVGGAPPPLELRWWHMFMLMQLDCMTPITQDAYIPSMPVMATELMTSESAIGLSLQINWIFSGFLAFALGVASDKYGRRPVILLAMTCYVAGALFCAMAPTVGWLIFARCVQGVGGGSQALCYTIARDCIQNDDERSKLFSLFSICATVAIAGAPIAGGLAAVLMGWRMVFVLLAAWGLLAFWNILQNLPETNPNLTAPPPEPVGGKGEKIPQPTGSSFGPIMDVFYKSLKPLGLIVSMWMMMPILMSILSSMPFVLDNTYGADTTAITWCTSSLAIFSLGGSAVCFMLMGVWTSWRVMRFGMCGLLLMGGLFVAFGLLQIRLTMVTFMVLPAFYIGFLTTIMGPMRSLVAQPFGAAAGAANGLVMSLSGPIGAFFGFSLTWIFQLWGVFAWMVLLGLLASFHQAAYWGLVGTAPEDDPIFEITEGYLQYLKSKGKGKGKK